MITDSKKSASRPFQTKYTEHWKAMAGVRQRIERYGRFVRYAEHDKVARVGYPLLCVKDAPYLNPNPLRQKSKRVFEIDNLITITIDVDSDLTVAELKSALPTIPVNFAVGRPTGDYTKLVRPHLIIELEYPVKRFPQTSSEIADKQKFDRIVDEIATRLVAAGHHVDAVNMTNVKNPDYEHWDTYADPNARAWTLKELLLALGMHGKKAPETLDVAAKVVSLANVRKKGWKAEVRGLKLDLQDDGSRNKRTFLHVREAICGAFRNTMDEQVILSVCQEAADEINATFAVPLKPGEINSICRSITKYMLKYGFERQSERNRGAAADLTENAEGEAAKKSRGARYTHVVRNQKSLQRVQVARRELGMEASKSEVARYLGMTRETVGKYWSVELDQLPAIKTAEAIKAKNIMLFGEWVKHRLHRDAANDGGVGYGAIREVGRAQRALRAASLIAPRYDEAGFDCYPETFEPPDN